MLLGHRLSSSLYSLSSLSRERKNNNNNNNNMEKKPIFDLYCEEDGLDLIENENGFVGIEQNVMNLNGSVFDSEKKKIEFLLDWCEDELLALFDKEKKEVKVYVLSGSMVVDRECGIEWILSVVSHYGFNALTTVLAVNYFDRFIETVFFQTENKPWMTQLAAVACLSIAAKVEETQVPLLLDLQVEEAKYVFEAKTIMRMELLVLSTLGWKMNPVTPLSFVDYVVRRLGMDNHLRLRFLEKCEHVLLSAITDSKFGSYLPSVLAAGTMLYVLKEVMPDNVLDCQSELLNILEMDMDKVEECYEFILDSQASYDIHKRKYMSTPNSPNGVIDAYFSSESSNDSWIAAPIVTSSPEPPFKRSRSDDQQMRVTHLRHL